MAIKRKKEVFKSPFVGIDNAGKYSVLYNEQGDYSVILQIENPCLDFAGDVQTYYDYHFIYSNICKILGAGYAIQKQDVFSKMKWESKSNTENYLMQKHFKLFDGRIYTNLQTRLVITGEVTKSNFFGFDEKKYAFFINNITKVINFLKDRNIAVKVMSKDEITNYLYRYFALDFEDDAPSLDNISARKNHIEIGDKNVQCISLVDVEQVDMPNDLKPFKRVIIADRQFPVDLFNFLTKIDVNTLVYNQVIQIPNQRMELNKLEAKKKKHSSMPDAENDICVEDIDKAMNDIARNGKMLVYSHYDIILSDKRDIDAAINAVESNLLDTNIKISKQSYNQFELFVCSMPGNSYELKYYDRFLTTADVAVNLMYKERPLANEKSDFNFWVTDRQGVPLCIDPSDLAMSTGRCNNRNKFILGPSGSGKSFYMNSMLMQYALADCDIVIVDTGHSYSGLNEYFKGKYITYSEEKPITMNPFQIEFVEYNEEKREFLKSLIALIWKGAGGILTQVEDTLLSNLIHAYYDSYFSEDNEKKEVKSLSFNTFYEFSLQEIPKIVEREKIQFDINGFKFVLKKFYRGGDYDKILNNDFDTSLFNEKFIVFEIDSIKEHKILFPIITLIIMDVFIQKMRLKKNRKVLVIEEAWKAIASPLMANYILYLYKTVRKFFGETMVVTQELDDIIKNEVVRSSIIANSDTVILLDQTKFKDNYREIADILALSEIEQNKIFTVNNLDNKEHRNKFKEVYIKRGGTGEVYGVEVSLHEYFTFTTERREKDAMKVYIDLYPTYHIALDTFISDFLSSHLTVTEFVSIINCKPIADIDDIDSFQEKKTSFIKEYRNSKMQLVEFINFKNKAYENEDSHIYRNVI